MKKIVNIMLVVCCIILIGMATYLWIIEDPRMHTSEAGVFMIIVAIATIVGIRNLDEK